MEQLRSKFHEIGLDWKRKAKIFYINTGSSTIGMNVHATPMKVTSGYAGRAAAGRRTGKTTLGILRPKWCLLADVFDLTCDIYKREIFILSSKDD